MSVRKEKHGSPLGGGTQFSPLLLLSEVRLGSLSGAALFWALVVLNQESLAKISQGLGKSELVTPFILQCGALVTRGSRGSGWIKNKTVLESSLQLFKLFHPCTCNGRD